MGKRAAGDKQWYIQFEPKVWLSDTELSLCRSGTRGIWADAICRMHLGDRTGRLTGPIHELARLCRAAGVAEMLQAIHDLISRDAADILGPDGDVLAAESGGKIVTKMGENVTGNTVVTLQNRRMSREWKDRKSSRERKKRSRDRLSSNECHGDVTPNVTPHSHSHSHNQPPTKPSAIPRALAPPKPDDGGGGILEKELKAAGVNGDELRHRLAAMPGLTPLGIRMASSRARKETDKGDGGAGLLVYWLKEGALPKLDLTPEAVVKLVKEGVIVAIGGQTVTADGVGYNSSALHIRDPLTKASIRAFKRHEIKAEILTLSEVA